MTKFRIRLGVVILFLVTFQTFGQTKRERIVLGGHDLWALSSASNNFYGLFIKKQLIDNWHDFEVRKINIKDYSSRPETVDHERVKKDNLVYVFLGFDSLNANIRGWKFESDYLLPGQSLLAGDYHIYAKGEIIETTDPTSTEVFDAVDNYRIGVKTKIQEKIIDQIITKEYRLTRWNVGNYLGGIKVDWVGDLDGDGRLEIIMTECGHHECFDIVIYSPDKNFKIREVFRNTICGG
jgi:hypothetical protein